MLLVVFPHRGHDASIERSVCVTALVLNNEVLLFSMKVVLCIALLVAAIARKFRLYSQLCSLVVACCYDSVILTLQMSLTKLSYSRQDGRESIVFLGGPFPCTIFPLV